MKTRKKIPAKDNNLDSIIGAGKAIDENTIPIKRKRGRPKNKIKKIQCPFYLPKNIVEAITDNCKGNKSVFAEEVFIFYFDSKKIDYRGE